MAQRHILCIGAHPDDNELSVGGTAALFRERGDAVKFVSVTNGDKGHFTEEYKQNPALLAQRRLVEAQNAAAVIGATYETLNVHDGEIYVDKETTEALVRVIRGFGEPGQGPDLVLFNRPQDYHRDHRYAAQMVLDATYMLTVPLMCPDTRHLDRMPAFAYWFDSFRDVQPFRADVVVSIDSVLDQKIDMTCAHVSQVFEWLPYNDGKLDKVPPASDPAGRRALLAEALRKRGAYRKEAVAYALEAWGCEEAEYVEAFQICEYGRVPNEDELRALFPYPNVMAIMDTKPVTYDELLDRARNLEGKTLKTVSGKAFTVGIYRDCPFFIPASTGLGRSDGRLAAERFLERFNTTASLRPKDYQDLTRNASYFVALVQS